MQAIYRERRLLVAELLDGAVCARCESAQATEVHEIKTRARGGSILDRENCVPLCHECHRWVTENPAAAREQGWLKNSWE
jgi:5-methylcytosine-specific restriction endonuclease McrA